MICFRRGSVYFEHRRAGITSGRRRRKWPWPRRWTRGRRQWWEPGRRSTWRYIYNPTEKPVHNTRSLFYHICPGQDDCNFKASLGLGCMSKGSCENPCWGKCQVLRFMKNPLEQLTKINLEEWERMYIYNF